MKVEELWKTREREWDDKIVDLVICPQDAALSMTIRLSRYANQDIYVWPYTIDATYIQLSQGIGLQLM